jgi:curved DNA-binding protein CbpA
MPDAKTTMAILQALESVSYYQILKVGSGAPLADIQTAFHDFALQYHPDCYVHEPKESAALADRIFKRGTEAFAVLSDPRTRPLYDEGLERGHLRYREGEAAEAAAAAALAAMPKVVTLEDIARSPRAKALARKADRLLLKGKIEEARLLLTDAVQDDVDNAELKARLDALYTADGYEILPDADGGVFEK